MIASDLHVGQKIAKDQLSQYLATTKNNIQNTDLFNLVSVDHVPINEQILEVLITVQERWYLWPLPILENADPNFNTWWDTKDFTRLNYGLILMQQNFRGRGEELGTLVQLGYSKRFALLYDVPFASPKGKTGVNFYVGYDQQNQITTSTANNKRVFYTGDDGNVRERWQLKLGLLQRHHVVTTQTLFASYNRVSIEREVLGNNIDYLDSTTAVDYLQLKYFFKHDKRDYRHYPLKGYYLDFIATQSGVGGNPDMFLTTFESAARLFQPIKGRFYAAAGIQGKYTLQDRIPYFLQEGLGYKNYIRGYEYYVIDGNHYFLAKTNLKYELVKKKTHELPFIKNPRFNKFYYALYLNVFSDLGYVQNNFSAQWNNLSNKWLNSFGVGLDFLTYYDTTIRFELSINGEGEQGFFLHFTQPI